MPTPAELISRGKLARKDGTFAAARAHYVQAAGIYREQNNRLAYAHAIRHVADIYQDEHKLLEAKPLYEEALALYRSDLDTRVLDLANAIRPYALLNEAQGNVDLAITLWQEARQLYASIQVQPGVSECDTHLNGR